jgi:hypothetical protein
VTGSVVQDGVLQNTVAMSEDTLPFSDEVHGLVGGDGVFGLRGSLRLPGQQLRCKGQL